MTMKSARFLGLALGLLCACIPAFPQGETGRISGVVTDQTGGAVVGATVTVLDVARGETRTLTSDGAGQYTAPNLIPGIYTVRGEAMGFRTFERQNVTVGVGGDIHVDMILQPGEQAQTVTVTAEIPQVNTTNAETGGTMQDNLLQALPINGGSYRGIIDKLPGVVKNPSGSVADQSTNGGDSAWDNYMLDGLYDVSVWMNFPTVGSNTTSGDTTLLPLDAIEEINLIENPKAEYGYFPGVTVDVGLKSGTNQIHGSAWAFGRGTAFDAKNAFTPGANALPAEFEQFGAVVGGPIKKDRIFYFAAYEGAREDVGYNFSVTAPSSQAGLGAGFSIPDAIAAINAAAAKGAQGNTTLSTLSLNVAGCDANNTNIHSTTVAVVATACAHNQYGSPNLWGNVGQLGSTSFVESPPDFGGSNNGLVKIDYKINDHHAFNAEYYMGDSVQQLPNTAQIGSIPTEPWWEEIFGVYTRTGRVVEIWTPNSNWLNEIRGGYDFQDQPEYNSECGVSGSTVGMAGGPASYLSSYGLDSGTVAFNGQQGCGFPEVTLTGFTGTLDGIGTRQGGGRDLQFSDVVSYTRGTHQFKWGYNLRKQCLCLEAKNTANATGVIGFGKSGDAAYAATVANGMGPATPAANALEDFLAGDPSSEAILYAQTALRNVHFNSMAVFLQDDWRIVPKLTLNLGFRWEGETPGRATNGQLGNFDPFVPSGMVQSNQMWGFQSSPSPHVGFAYDLTGKGTTVIRGGGTIAYAGPAMTAWTTSTSDSFQQEPHRRDPLLCQWHKHTWSRQHHQYPHHQNSNRRKRCNRSTATALPWVAFSVPSGVSNPIWTAASVSTAACAKWAASPRQQPAVFNPPTCSLYGDYPSYKLPYVETWNLSAQHAFTPSITLNVAYVGTHGTDLLLGGDINDPTPGIAGSSVEQLRRTFYTAANNGYGDNYPWFGKATFNFNGGTSNYNGLQVTFSSRAYHGLAFNAGYTWSHALQSVANLYNLPNPTYGGATNYGNASVDFRQRFTLTASYNIPGRKSPLQMLEGWSVSSVILILTPASVTASESGIDASGTGEGDEWNLYGSAKDFDALIGAVTHVPCFAVAGSKFAGGGCTVKTAGSGAIGTPGYVANMPASCVAAATADSTSDGGLWDVANNPAVPVGATQGYNGLAQLALVGCYVAGPNNESAIVPPAQGTFGTMQPGELRNGAAGGYKNWDLSLQKNWLIKERFTFQFRAEAFNMLNRVDYSTPGSYGALAGNDLSQNSVFGTSQATDDISKGNPLTGPGGPRLVQLALKILF